MRAIVLLLFMAPLALGGCGKEKTPKVDAATEQAEALERARKGPMGAQVQALDKAKALEADLNKKAAENLEKADPK